MYPVVDANFAIAVDFHVLRGSVWLVNNAIVGVFLLFFIVRGLNFNLLEIIIIQRILSLKNSNI